MTFSVLAADPATHEVGVAVASHALSVGAGVPAVATHGVVVSQGFSNRELAPEVLARVGAGESPARAISEAVASDRHREGRQLAAVTPGGDPAVFTGRYCVPFASGMTSGGVAVVGNMLVSEGVLHALLEGFQEAAGPLGQRLLSALRAAEEAGGDVRGRQSAALRVLRRGESTVDLRVDDDPDPLSELGRLYELRLAADRIGDVVLGDGLVMELAESDQPDGRLEERCRRALEDLLELPRVYGDNPEPLIWAGLLAARLDDPRADELFARAAELTPSLADFSQRLRESGLISDRPE